VFPHIAKWTLGSQTFSNIGVLAPFQSRNRFAGGPRPPPCLKTSLGDQAVELPAAGTIASIGLSSVEIQKKIGRALEDPGGGKPASGGKEKQEISQGGLANDLYEIFFQIILRGSPIDAGKYALNFAANSCMIANQRRGDAEQNYARLCR